MDQENQPVKPDQSNLLKLVTDLGMKIDTVKSNISASELDRDKWKATLLKAQQALRDRRLQVHRLRLRLSSEKERLAEKEEQFNACLSEIQVDLGRLTETRACLAQSRLDLTSVAEQRDQLAERAQQHAEISRQAGEATESAEQLTAARLRAAELQQEQCRLEGRLCEGAAARAARQEVSAAEARRHALQGQLADRDAAEAAAAAAADRINQQIQQRQEEMSGEQLVLADQLSRARDDQRRENDRLRALELRTAELRSQLDDADSC